MNKKKALWGLFLVLLFLFTLNSITPLQKHLISIANSIKSDYLFLKKSVYDKITLHLHQKSQIEELRREIEKLRPAASLSVAFASKLNGCLKELNLTKYDPRLIPARVLSYERLENPKRLWIAYKTDEHNYSHGLLYRGFSAGIVREKLGQPLAILQTDRSALFSVMIGKEKIPAVIFGNGENMIIKYIPLYKHPKEGDEVYTSGKDGLFFEGIKVGKITKIMTKKIYKSAIVTPYVTIENPHFFYVVDVN
ncbi:MAG: hypothetical protein B6D59_00600 [Campylobacteraceae bacterium 4484_4]|nr:MAG: hypothetical protein B6D59_00600 [Campylobacteraceae bacterium 4484_4]